MAASQATSPVTNERHSSSPWTAPDDNQLMRARAQGLNWAPIAAQYFPTKTPNACRKRHERLMEKRSQQENWDGVKVEALARAYLDVREHMWKMVADKVGEKWQVVESKCMEKGLKNLQNANRTLVKKERNQPVQEDAFNDSGLPMDDTAANNATDVSSEMGRDDQHPFLDASDEHIQAHSGRGEEQQQQQQQQSSSYSHIRDSQMYPTEVPSSICSYTPHRTFSTTSSASTFTPVSATSTTLPPIRSSLFATILQSNPVTTH